MSLIEAPELEIVSEKTKAEKLNEDEITYTKIVISEYESAVKLVEHLETEIKKAKALLASKNGAKESWTAYLFNRYGLRPEEDMITADGLIKEKE